MKRTALPARLMAVLAAWCLTVPSVSAGELLVMPFQCRLTDGRVTLIPSEQTGHQVLGRRETRDVTACSPADSRRCRHIQSNRFTVDCGGSQVPWVAVAAAAPGARNGRARLDGGRLHLRMPADWALSPDDPCAREFSAGPGFPQGGISRYCSDRAALTPPAYIDLPVGFAPMLGIDAIFVPDGAPPLAAGPGAMGAAPQASPQASPQAAARKKQLPPELAPRQVTSAPPQPERPVEAPGTSPDPPTAASVPPVIALQTPVEPKPLALVTPDSPSAAAPPGPPTAAASTTGPAAAPTPPTAIETARDTASTAVASLTAGQATAPPAPAVAPPHGLTALLFAGDGIALLLGPPIALVLGLLGWMLMRRGAAPVDPPVRDPFALSLGTGGTSLALDPRGPTDLATPATAAATPPATIEWPSAVPHSREDALRVLGMGVSADASAAALKKMVDALRVSWHPDHARDDSDRATREQRMRQINAAWDILSGDPPVAAPPPAGAS